MRREQAGGEGTRPALPGPTLAAIYRRVASRYDLQHGLLTVRSDQRGRRLAVRHAVAPGESVLDCGGGTGSTALLAARRTGPGGRVTLLDLSDGMIQVARARVRKAGLEARIRFAIGDLLSLPFRDDSFDAVLSTYSLCPVYDPAAGAREMLRVLKPGGRIGIAHSGRPAGRLMRWLADRVEHLVWRFPLISLGCRPVRVLPALQSQGAQPVFETHIGVPLWPFEVFVCEKPR